MIKGGQPILESNVYIASKSSCLDVNRSIIWKNCLYICSSGFHHEPPYANALDEVYIVKVGVDKPLTGECQRPD